MFPHAPPRRKTVIKWRLVWISIAISEVITIPVSFATRGRLSLELLAYGFLVPLFVAPVMIYISFAMRRKAELERENIIRQYRELVESTHAIHWELDLSTLKFIYVSPQVESILGYPVRSWTDLDFRDGHVHPDDRDRTFGGRHEHLGKGEDHEFVYRMVRADGGVVWLRDIVHVVTGAGEPEKLQGITFDITGQVRTQEKLRESLREKDVLIREVHHRAKNSLAVIASLLNLQCGKVRDGEAREMLLESRNRVRAMSMIHEMLYRTEDISHMNFGEYIRLLSERIYRNYSLDGSLVRLSTEVPDITVDLDMVIPCGLIINELITNSLKHAFPGGGTGELHVGARDLGEGVCELVVRDNGVGLPAGMDIGEADSLGMRLVTLLTNQIAGKLEVTTGNGTEFVFTFRRNIREHLQPVPHK